MQKSKKLINFTKLDPNQRDKNAVQTSALSVTNQKRTKTDFREYILTEISSGFHISQRLGKRGYLSER